MLGHHRYDSETPFEWHFAGGPMLARLWWYLGGIWIVSPLINLEKKRCKTSDPLWQNFLGPHKMRKLVCAFTVNKFMMYERYLSFNITIF